MTDDDLVEFAKTVALTAKMDRGGKFERMRPEKALRDAYPDIS